MFPLMLAWKCCSGASIWEKCGFAVTPLDAKNLAGSVDWQASPLFEEANRWPELVVGLLCSLTRNRLRHLLAYTQGPGSFVGLLHYDPACVQKAPATLQAIWRGWGRMADITATTAQKCMGTSWLQRLWVDTIMESLSLVGRQVVPDEVVTCIRSVFACGSTQ